MRLFLPTLAIAIAAPIFSANAASELDAVLRQIEHSSSIPTNLRTLCDEIGPRMAGTSGMQRAVEWARPAFEKAGVDAVTVEAAAMPVRWQEGASSVTALGEQSFPLRAASSALSPATPIGGIEAPLVYAGTGSQGRILRRRKGFKGKILLIRLHEVESFEGLAVEQRNAMVAVREAAQVQAAGVLFISTRPNGIMYRHINNIDGQLDPIPSAIVAREDGLRLMRLLDNNHDFLVRLDLPNKISGPYETHSVIAEIPGSGLSNEVVLLAAHLDSWDMGTGCLDNAANVALVIETARAITAAKASPRRTIRFALFGGEEFGLFGSRAYVRRRVDELDNHVAVIVHDMGIGPVKGYSLGGRHDLLKNLESALAPVHDRWDLEHLTEAFFGSDHFDFLLQGVPSLVAIQDTSNYHSPYHSEADTFDKIEMKQVRDRTALAAATVLGIANLDERFGKRYDHNRVDNLLKDSGLDDQMKFLGIWEAWQDGDRSYRESR